MKIKVFFLAVLMGLINILLCACDNFNNQNNSNEVFYSFTDSLENKVELASYPSRVAILFSSYAQIWNIAGGKIAITVGDSVERGFASENVLLVDSGAGMNINTELLMSYNPDFVIASADMQAQVNACEKLKNIGVACALFKEEKFEDYLYILKIFTDINQTPDSYINFGLSLQDKIVDTIKQAEYYSNIKESVSVLFIRAGSGASSTRAKTAENHFVGVMLKELKTFNIADEANELSETLSLEHILINQPDIIFIVLQGDEAAAKAYMNNLFSEAGWRSLNAVIDNKVFYLPKNMFHYKPNELWADAYEYLFNLIYKE